MAPRHPARQGVEAALAAAGATASVVVETPGYAVVCALVSAGLGIAVVPEMVARTAATPLGWRPLEPGTLRRTISVAYRGDEAAPAADAFRALLRGAFGRAARHVRGVMRLGAQAGPGSAHRRVKAPAGRRP
ncbi:hypothetical protein GCM10022206_36380 [Streptomyces chiangmaiensis]